MALGIYGDNEKGVVMTETTRLPIEPWMTAWERNLIRGGWLMSKATEQDTRVGHPDIGCVGACNGSGEPCREGSYVKLVATWPAGGRQEMVISRGMAANLVAQLQGAME